MQPMELKVSPRAKNMLLILFFDAPMEVKILMSFCFIIAKSDTDPITLKLAMKTMKLNMR